LAAYREKNAADVKARREHPNALKPSIVKPRRYTLADETTEKTRSLIQQAIADQIRESVSVTDELTSLKDQFIAFQEQREAKIMAQVEAGVPAATIYANETEREKAFVGGRTLT